MGIRKYGNIVILALLLLSIGGYVIYGFLPRGSAGVATSLTLSTPWPGSLTLGNITRVVQEQPQPIPVHWHHVDRLYGTATWLIETNDWSQNQLLDALPKALGELKQVAEAQLQPPWAHVTSSFDLEVRIKSSSSGVGGVHVARVFSLDRKLYVAERSSEIRDLFLQLPSNATEFNTPESIVRASWTDDLEWVGDRRAQISEFSTDKLMAMVPVAHQAVTADGVSLTGSSFTLTVDLFNPADSSWNDVLLLSLNETNLQELRFAVPAHQRASLVFGAQLPSGNTILQTLQVSLADQSVWSRRILILPDTYVLKDHQAAYTEPAGSREALEEAGSELHLQSIQQQGTTLFIGFESADCKCYINLKALLSDLALPSDFHPEPPKLEFAVIPDRPHVGQAVVFQVLNLDRVNSETISLGWEIGGEEEVITAAHGRAQHTFSQLGKYSVTLLISQSGRTRRIEKEINVGHTPTPVFGVGVSYLSPVPVADFTVQMLVSESTLAAFTAGFTANSGVKQNVLDDEVPYSYSLAYGIISLGQRISEVTWMNLGGGFGLMTGMFRPKWPNDSKDSFQYALLLIRTAISWNIGPLQVSFGFNYQIPYAITLATNE